MAYILKNSQSTITANVNMIYKTYMELRESMTNVFNHIHNNKKLQSIVMNNLEKYKNLNMAHFITYNFNTCVNKENLYKIVGFISRLNNVIEKTKTVERRIENIDKICGEFVGETLKYCSINLFVHIDTPNKGFKTLEAINIYDVVNDITPVAYCIPFSEQTFGLLCVHQSDIQNVVDKINTHNAVLNDESETHIKMYCVENYTLFKTRKKVFDWASKGQTSYVNITSNHSIPLTKVIEYSSEWSSRP